MSTTQPTRGLKANELEEELEEEHFSQDIREENIRVKRCRITTHLYYYDTELPHSCLPLHFLIEGPMDVQRSAVGGGGSSLVLCPADHDKVADRLGEEVLDGGYLSRVP